MAKTRNYNHMKRTHKKFYTHEVDEYNCKMELCMGAWSYGCMRNDSNRLIISIHTAAFKFITCRHTVMHSNLTTA